MDTNFDIDIDHHIDDNKNIDSSNQSDIIKDHDEATVSNVKKKESNKPKIDLTYCIKTKLNCITSDNNLKNILHDRTININKIILEGMYLFHIYMLHILSNNICMEIDENTIRRCIRILIPDSAENRKKDDEDTLIKFVNEKYFNLDKSFSSFKGLTSAIDSTTNPYYTNLQLHISRNFKRYQKKYLRSRLRSYAKDNNYNISDSDIKFILHAVQHKINGNSDYSYKIEKRKNKYAQLSNDIKLDNFINNESKILKSCISFDIDTSDELDSKSIKSDKIFHYLKYFFHIESELIKNSVKGIHIIPHFVPKVRSIKWEARALYDVYNVWKLTLNKSHKCIDVISFQDNFDKYFSEMFPKIKIRYKKMLKKITYCTINSNEWLFCFDCIHQIEKQYRR